MDKIIAIDVGTSAIKVCVFKMGDSLELIYREILDMGLYSPEIGYAEHDAEEVWECFCKAINDIFTKGGISPEEIAVVSLCSQAQCVVLVDKEGNALTPIYNSQDARAVDSYIKYYSHGLKFDGVNLVKVAKCYISTGFMPGSAKDPVFKYKWAEDHLPEVYKKTYKWLDIKDYIICKLTGRFATTKDNAHAYTIYKSKTNDCRWSRTASKVFNIDMGKLPEIVDSFEVIGTISSEALGKTGLRAGTTVIGGVIDVTGVQYGSGATDLGEAMVYWGTSGWVSTVTNRLVVDLAAKIGALITAEDNKFNFYAMLDSAGISYKWLREKIIEDNGILSADAQKGAELSEAEVYEKMSQAVSETKCGADGLMFTPWITGCRAPMEASDIGGMFLNVKNFMDKKHFIRAVIEGVCYHYRLLIDVSAKTVSRAKKLRFVGGGANSAEISQILADITGCVVEVPSYPQDAGAVGAAIVGLYALNRDKTTLEELSHSQQISRTYVPNEKNHALYNQYYEVYKSIYNKNKKILSKLSSIGKDGEK